MHVDPNGQNKYKRLLRFAINAIFNDFINNTLTNIVLVLSSGGFGEWTARRLAIIQNPIVASNQPI